MKAAREGANRGQDGWMAHCLSGHEFEQIPGDGEGQGSLACCSPCGVKESDMTEQLNNNITISLLTIFPIKDAIILLARFFMFYITSHDLFILYWKFVILNPLHLFAQPPLLSFSNLPFFLYIQVCFQFILFCFLDSRFK